MTYHQGKRKKYFKPTKQLERLKLFISGEFRIMGCWRFERRYQKLDGIYLHQQWASGKGEIVRHLCGDSRCVNPLHLMRGDDIENAKDELEIRDFSIKALQILIGEKYDDRYVKELCILILMPRVRRIYNDRFKTMSEVAQFGREGYRKQFEENFAKSYNIENSMEEFDNMRGKFIQLASRSDIIIEEI